MRVAASIGSFETSLNLWENKNFKVTPNLRSVPELEGLQGSLAIMNVRDSIGISVREGANDGLP